MKVLKIRKYSSSCSSSIRCPVRCRC